MIISSQDLTLNENRFSSGTDDCFSNSHYPSIKQQLKIKEVLYIKWLGPILNKLTKSWKVLLHVKKGISFFLQLSFCFIRFPICAFDLQLGLTVFYLSKFNWCCCLARFFFQYSHRQLVLVITCLVGLFEINCLSTFSVGQFQSF